MPKRHNCKGIDSFCYIVLFLYIVGGNMLTFNFGNRMPIKVAEICSIILCIWYILKYHNVSFYTHEKEIMIWLLMGFFFGCYRNSKVSLCHSGIYLWLAISYSTYIIYFYCEYNMQACV